VKIPIPNEDAQLKNTRIRSNIRATDSLVLKAIKDSSRGMRVITVSLRDIEKLTLISKTSIGRSIKRLMVSGVLKRFPIANHPQAAARYEILDTEALTLEPSPLWSRKGLGTTPAHIYQSMVPGTEYTVRELGALTDIPVSTIRSNLKKLYSAALIDGINRIDGANPRKRHWVRIDDDAFLIETEVRLMAEQEEMTHRRIRREQNEWRTESRSLASFSRTGTSNAYKAS
jgi:predicted transcriptional regulator